MCRYIDTKKRLLLLLLFLLRLPFFFSCCKSKIKGKRTRKTTPYKSPLLPQPLDPPMPPSPPPPPSSSSPQKGGRKTESKREEKAHERTSPSPPLTHLLFSLTAGRPILPLQARARVPLVGPRPPRCHPRGWCSVVWVGGWVGVGGWVDEYKIGDMERARASVGGWVGGAGSGGSNELQYSCQ